MGQPVHPLSLYPFPVFRDYRFRLGGKNYCLGAHGVRALALLANLAEQAPQHRDAAWLVAWRGHIRAIQRLSPRAAMTLVVDRAEEERLRCLAIWLRGRCGGTLGTSTVSRFATSQNWLLRKEVTRCLKRLRAWPELRRIVAHDPDPRLRRMANQSAPKAYAIRLAAFSRHVSSQTIRPGQSGLVVAAQVNFAQPHRPKPRWQIRMMLERIRRAVRRPLR